MPVLKMTYLAMAASLVFAGLANPVAAQFTQRLTMAQAEQRCLYKTSLYASDYVGPGSRPRTHFEITSFYKRCIYGYTGQNPTNIPNFRRY